MMNMQAVKRMVKGSLCLYMAAGVNQSKMLSPVHKQVTVNMTEMKLLGFANHIAAACCSILSGASCNAVLTASEHRQVLRPQPGYDVVVQDTAQL